MFSDLPTSFDFSFGWIAHRSSPDRGQYWARRAGKLFLFVQEDKLSSSRSRDQETSRHYTVPITYG